MIPVFRQIFKDTIEFIFPPTCIVSDRRLPDGNSNKYITDDVFTSLETTSVQDLVDLNGKLDSDEYFGFYTLRPDSRMEKIIHHIKYSGMRNLGVSMGENIGRILAESCKGYDYIIPVPLHKVRIRERHYNQSDYIVKGISKAAGIEALPDAVKRTRYTKTQTRLSRAERIENVRGAFEINREYRDLLKDKNLIVIDDIITTGSTVNEVIRILKEAGCGKILGGCLAMARDPKEDL